MFPPVCCFLLFCSFDGYIIPRIPWYCKPFFDFLQIFLKAGCARPHLRTALPCRSALCPPHDAFHSFLYCYDWYAPAPPPPSLSHSLQSKKKSGRKRRAAASSPQDYSSLFSSLSCSCPPESRMISSARRRTDGIGRPMAAAFSSTEMPSLAMNQRHVAPVTAVN